MKILVMGTGAVGGCLGGMLARTGEEVTFVARGQHLEAVRRQGLRVESTLVGDFVVRAPAVERPDGSWKADLVLFCVKSYSNTQAIETIRPAVGGSTAILTLQNGIGSGEQLAAAFGWDRVLLGAAYIEAMRKGPGVVGQAGPCRIVFGEPDGRQSQRALRVRDALQRAGVEAELSSDVMAALWSKLVFICALSGMSCITRSSFAEVMDTPATCDLAERVMREAEAVARARGVKLDADIVERNMAYFQENKKDLVSSMYLDFQAGNPLELSVINGAVSRLGKEAGVATPINDFITACLSVADQRARKR